jgi:hypothetical protein
LCKARTHPPAGLTAACSVVDKLVLAKFLGEEHTNRHGKWVNNGCRKATLDDDLSAAASRQGQETE